MEGLSARETFENNCQVHLQRLTLKGLQPKTIEAYSRAIRRVGAYFAYAIDDLTQEQLADHFLKLKSSHAWSSLKLDLYAMLSS